MSRIVISSTTDSTAWDDNNSVTIDTVWNAASANTWSYVSGNMSLLGASGGTWDGPGLFGSQVGFSNRSNRNIFSLATSGSFPTFNPFANMRVGASGGVFGGPSDGDTWTLTVR